MVEPNDLDLADSNSSDSNCLDCPESNSLESDSLGSYSFDSLGSYSFDSPESNSSSSNSSNSCQCVLYESSSRLCLLRNGRSCALSNSITCAPVLLAFVPPSLAFTTPKPQAQVLGYKTPLFLANWHCVPRCFGRWFHSTHARPPALCPFSKYPAVKLFGRGVWTL